MIVLRPVAIARGWVDVPQGRKQHLLPTPLTGGLAIFASLLFWLAWNKFNYVSLRSLALASALLFVIAFFDDRKPIRARYRLLAQVAAALVIVVGDQLTLAPMTVFDDLKLFLGGWWSVACTGLGIVAMVNAFNMADGVDGATGGFVAVVLIALIAVFLGPLAGGFAERGELLLVTLIVLGTTLGFLLFNYPVFWRRSASAFLGDSGSMLLALITAWLLLKAGQPSAHSGKVLFGPAYALWLVALPLFDATLCFLRRMLSGQLPMTPDRKHMHHLVQALGVPNKRVAPTLNAIAAIMAAIGVVGWHLHVAEPYMFWSLVMLFGVYCAAVMKLWSVLKGAIELGVDRFGRRRPLA